MISIDGMRPDYVLKADEHGLKIPHLRRILKDGAHATGVRGVLPTVTYPSHTTILTGVWPVKHHIYSNVVFDPLDLNLAGWMWYAEDIAVPTLWQAASKAGLVVGSVSWPVSVAAPGIAYNVPEYWRAPKFPGEDLKLLRAISTPGLIAEIEKQAGPYVTDLDDAAKGDRQRTRYAIAILKNKHAQFMTVHLASLDHLEHGFGPFSPEANATLEQIDQEVGELEDAAPDAVVCVLSDHGFTRTDHNFNIVAAFAEEGLVTMVNKKVTDWKAYPRSRRRLRRDHFERSERRSNARQSREVLASPRRRSEKRHRANSRSKANRRNSVDAPTPRSGSTCNPILPSSQPTARTKVGGTHGYAPSNPQLLASFFIAGPKIKPGVDLGEIDMRSIAATLAKAMGISFTSADLPALPVF